VWAGFEVVEMTVVVELVVEVGGWENLVGGFSRPDEVWWTRYQCQWKLRS
jgi:hypothetical protein